MNTSKKSASAFKWYPLHLKFFFLIPPSLKKFKSKLFELTNFSMNIVPMDKKFDTEMHKETYA